jgi:predicted phage tail protein
MAGFRIVVAIVARSGAAAVTPVQKVLTMMNEMKTKGESMMKEESAAYATYKEWVSDTSREVGFEIKTAKSDIEKLTAKASKADSEVAKLGAAIAKEQEELAATEGEKKDATDIRNSQHAEYMKTSTDYSESVDALERAIQTMQTRNMDVPEAEMFLQNQAVAKPGMRRVLAAFLQATQTQEVARGGPAVAAYEFQSGGIVELLEKFLTKFKGELEEVEREESNQAKNYDLEMINLSNTIDYMKKEIQEKSQLKAKRAGESAQAKSDLSATKKELAEDEKTLADMKATFAAKSDQFEANQEVRKQELEAIGKAIEIISDPKVAGSYGEHVNFAQVKTSLLQVSRTNTRQHLTAFLQQKAQALSSEALKNLAAQVESNPFDKVVKMIEDLVAKLKEEAAAEAEHKAWCDEQLHDNKLKREKKTSKVNKLTATIEALTQDIASMGKKIQTLKNEQADQTLAMSKATTVRDQEKATNTDTMADAKAGEAATKAALVVLKEFYASQGSFVQQVPEMAAYKGMSSAKGGVVGMLEVITSDFARLFADTKASETAAAAEYDAFMKDMTTSNKAKHDLEFKTSLAKDKAEFEKGENAKDLESTQEELNKALEYQEYLKPVCLEVHVSYEERVARRKEEVAALKEAYEILDKK